ncbi:hypothetical protein RCL1_004524 [Eukaryota sp. TZLM3-RCL]
MSLNDLPSKERSAYTSMIRQYESKNYKKALKVADQILTSHPRNGDTLAMKALILSTSQPKKLDEAFDMAKTAIKFCIKSHITWHVLGLLHKAKEEYPAALKAFKTALRHDSQNPQVLKDTCLLQMQLGDFSDTIELRRLMLTQNSKPSGNWYGFAVSNDLAGNTLEAIDILKNFLKTVEGVDVRSSNEKSEVYLYLAELLLKAEKYEELHQLLTTQSNDILDSIKSKELMVVCGQRGFLQVEELQLILKELITINEDNGEYILNYLKTFNQEEHFNVIKKLLQEFPKSNVLHEILVENSSFSADLFAESLRIYVSNYPVPSLFPVLKNFNLKFPDFSDYIFTVTESVAEFFISESNYSKAAWLFYALGRFCLPDDVVRAQNYSSKCDEYFELSNQKVAESHVLAAEIARVQKDYELSINHMSKARQSDPGDRYLNHLSVEIMLESGNISGAEQLSKEFIGDKVSKSYAKTLLDFQICFLEILFAQTYKQQGEYGKALYLYNAVQRHFMEYVDEFFDFHLYCVSRGMLRAYVAALRELRQYVKSEYYMKAVVGSAEIYSILAFNEEERQRLIEMARTHTQASTVSTTVAEEKDGEEKQKGKDAEVKESRQIDHDASLEFGLALLEKNPSLEYKRMIETGDAVIRLMNDHERSKLQDIVSAFESLKSSVVLV